MPKISATQHLRKLPKRVAYLVKRNLPYKLTKKEKLAKYRIVQNAAKRGLYHGQHIRFGMDKSRKSGAEYRRCWRPNAHRKWFYSEILQRRMRIKVTTTALKAMDKHGGIDRYILGVRHLGGELGPRLREEMIQKLHGEGRLTAHELKGSVKGNYYLPVPAAEQPVLPVPTEPRFIEMKPGIFPKLSQKIPGVKMRRQKKEINWKYVREDRKSTRLNSSHT